jgi:DnaJ-domain-containing protein 1
VDGFIDRLAGFLRDLLGDGGGSRGNQAGTGGNQDPDLRDAWEELDDYMRGGTGERAKQGDRTSQGAGTGAGSGQDGSRQSRGARPAADESLRQDYANLEVPFGADIDTVRKSYKTLIMRYHPDKHAGDPEKQRLALEITKKVNQSFEKIRSRHEDGHR